MEVVTYSELAQFFEQLRESIQALSNKLEASDGTDSQQYFTREEAAVYLRIGKTKLDDLASRGEIRGAKLGEGRSQVLFRRVDLDAFVEEHLEMDRHEARRRARDH